MSHVAVHIQMDVHSKHGCGRVDALLVLSVAFISVFRASIVIKQNGGREHPVSYVTSRVGVKCNISCKM